MVASAPDRGSSQLAHLCVSGSGSRRQHSRQTPPSKKLSTSLSPHARHRVGKRKPATDRAIPNAALAADFFIVSIGSPGILWPFRPSGRTRRGLGPPPDEKAPNGTRMTAAVGCAEVSLTTRRSLLSLALLLGSALSAHAQNLSVGASVGLANDLRGSFRLDGFHRTDWNTWASFTLEEQVLLRATVGSLLVQGANAGRIVPLPPGGPGTRLPGLTDRIDYLTVGASYEFWEGDYASGLFGGIGAYKVDPGNVQPQFGPYRDIGETVFGWHAGVDARVHIASRVSLIGRLTFHRIFSLTNRSLLNANAGVEYRF